MINILHTPFSPLKRGLREMTNPDVKSGLRRLEDGRNKVSLRDGSFKWIAAPTYIPDVLFPKRFGNRRD